MAEIGMSPEAAKIGLKQKVVEAFTPKGAKEKWYREHAEVVKKYADVSNGLSDEQRAQVMAKIDDDATKSANINVVGKWGAVALTTAALGVSGGLIKSETFRNWVAKGHLGKWQFGEGLKNLGLGGEKNLGIAKDKIIALGRQAKDGLDRVIAKIVPINVKIDSLDSTQKT